MEVESKLVLTAREEAVLDEILTWEERLHQYETTDLAVLYDKWIESAFSLLPEQTREQFFSKLDTWLFHLHAIVQNSEIQMNAKQRILTSARVFNEDISEVQQLKGLTIDQLNYIANQQISKHRIYSFAQGGLTGSGGVLLFGDLPAMTIINVRVVQLIATTYGYDGNTPLETMLALKVFHAGMLPKRMQSLAWANLLEEIKTKEDDYFYLGDEELTDLTWMEQPLKQILKLMAISIFNKKQIQGIPFISMAIGAGTNYQMTRRVSEFAQKFYQYRYLYEKQLNE